ncbi:MAG: TonB-dependent receptor [Bacteroidota bacterium]
MKKIIYILSLFIITTNTFAQQSLSGTVTDSKKAGIAGVSVFIPDLQTGTTTDDKGSFSLSNLPKTSLNIQFTSVGYKSQVKTVTSETNAALEVTMELSATELEEVLVTSSNTKLPDNVPFSAVSISQAGIRKYSSPSVMGNLSYQPGIDKITIGNGIGKPVIRGLSFNQIMLYSQGTRIENQQWDDHHDLGLSDVGVENVEIVRGPAALIYGADALGGALIFVDEKPAAAGTTQSDLNLGFGSNTVGIDGDIGLKSTGKNGFFYGIRLGGASHTSYLQGEGEKDKDKSAGKEAEPVAANSRFMNMIAKVNAGVSKKWGVSKFSYSFFNQQLGIVEDEGAVPDSVKAAEDEEEVRFGREMEAPYQDVTTHIISLENTFITGKSKVNLNIGYQVNDRKEFEPEGTNKKPDDAAIGLILNTTTYDIKWTSNVERKFGVTIGSQGTFLKNENNGKEALVPNADVSDIAGYGLLRLDLDKLNLLGGVRYDMRHIEAESYEKQGVAEEDTFVQFHYSDFPGSSIDTIQKLETDFKKDYTPVSFSLGACYHAGEHFTVKLNGATGFSAPNYAQLGTFGKHEGTYRFERGNAELKVEQNMEGDLGLIWENQFITFNLGGYLNMIKNYIYIESTSDTMVRITPDGRDTLPIYDYKQGDATLSGIEAGFDIHPASAKWLDISISYSMTKGTLENPINGNKNLPYIPAGKLVGELRLMKSKLWKFTDAYFACVVSNYSDQGNLSYYEKLDADAAKAEGFDFEGYTLLDIHIGASFKLGKQKATFDIFGTNILNTGYFNQLSLVKYIGVRDMGANFGVRLHVPICAISR